MKISAEKIKNWFKDKHNRILVLVLMIGILLRLYYLIITANQPLWWDEAEYLLMGKFFATGELFTGLMASRPLLWPMIVSFLMKINLGKEIIFRIIEFLVSSIGLIFLYLTTKKLFNKEVGIIAALFLSVFYLHLFYTARLLLDSLAPTFWIISIYFFTEGYLLKKDNKKFYLSAFFGSLGVFIYNQTIAIFIIYLIFLLITEKLKLFKEKKFYIFALVAILTFIPNFIANQVLYKNPLEFVKVGFEVGNVAEADYWGNIKIFLGYMPEYLSSIFLVLFIISLIVVFYKLILGIDLVFKKPDLEEKKQLFMFLWLIVSFLVIVKIVGHFEDRYIMPTFLPIFIITALGLWILKEKFTKPENKRVLYAALIILLIIVSFTQIKQADQIIKLKKDSFIQVKEAGFWLKENSAPQDKVITSFLPMLAYYSERQITTFPGSEEELIPAIKKEKPKYLLISIFTGNPNYINNIQNYQMLKLVFTQKEGDNITLAVFEIDYNHELLKEG